MPEIRKMAAFGAFLEGAPRGALSEGAQRFESIVNVVKDQQLARTNSGARLPDSDVYILSPEEAWSKKYMTQCIGPVCTIKPTAEGLAEFPGPAPKAQAAEPPMVYEAKEAPKAAEPAKRGGRKLKAPKPEPIGLAIGKPIRSRSLLGRLFLGS